MLLETRIARIALCAAPVRTSKWRRPVSQAQGIAGAEARGWEGHGRFEEQGAQLIVSW